MATQAEKIRAMLGVIKIVQDTIKELGEVPSGHPSTSRIEVAV